MKTTRAILAALAAFAIPAAVNADITTGWGQTTKGVYSFLSSENWADATVSGMFSPDWAPASGDIDIYLDSDWTGSFKVLGSVSARTIIRASNGPHTVTLDDDLYLTPASMGADFVFGNGYEEKKKLNLDLGGVTRKVFMNGGNRWIVSDRISNGDLEFDGSGTLTFRSAGGSDGAIALSTNLLLQTAFTSSDKTDIDAVRAVALTLNRSRVQFTEAQVNVTDRITGLLTVLGDEPSCSVLYPRATTAGKTETVRIGGLDMRSGATLLVRGAKVGGDAKVFFDRAPETIGGIVPHLVGSTTDSDSSGFTLYDQTFVTYDAENGIVPINRSTGYETGLSGEIAESANVLVGAGQNYAVEGNVTVNSLLLDSTGYNVAPGTVSGDGTLAVSSGMVMAKPYKDYGKAGTQPQIGVALDFGNVMGHIVNAGSPGYRVRIGKPVSGTSGLALAHLVAPTTDMKNVITSGLGSFEVEGTSGDSSYTGDTYVQSVLKLNGNSFLPNGMRRGDVYVNGALECSSSGPADVTINGLYGNGLIYGRNGTLTIGDNDADGDFSGAVSVSGNTTVLANLNKTGSGTQRFSGNVMLGTALNVNAGAVVLDGTVAQGAVNVAAGAAIGGGGEIQTSLAFADGAKLAVDVADGVAKCLDVTGAVTGGPVTVDASIAGSKWSEPQCVLRSGSAIAASFARGKDVGSLELRENGTELWAIPVADKGTLMVFR